MAFNVVEYIHAVPQSWIGTRDDRLGSCRTVQIHRLGKGRECEMGRKEHSRLSMPRKRDYLKGLLLT